MIGFIFCNILMAIIDIIPIKWIIHLDFSIHDHYQESNRMKKNIKKIY
jgi:hypothetical protein